MIKRFLLFIALLLFALPAAAEERILSYDSAIEVFADGSMQVTEKIVVQAEGEQIKRGIFRDFPTDYTDHYGNRYRVDFSVVGVLRDGVTEPYHTKRQGNGVRVYIGSKGVLLQPGAYAYELTYRTNRQLGYFDNHDELYWNVTGNDWAFPIDAVTATVALPEVFSKEELGAEAYTGRRGAKGGDYVVERGIYGEPVFTASRPLARGEGLTIVVTWPKGYVAEPTAEQKAGYLIRDNHAWGAAVLGLFVILLYYVFAWFSVGRDPKEGVIIARYEPPVGYSPASTRFIGRMGYDHKCFASAVVNLAVGGLVEIIEENGEYVLKRTGQKTGRLAAGEKVLLKALFGRVDGVAGKRQSLNQRYHAKLGKALKKHEESLRNNYETRFFVTNRWWVAPGVLLSLLTYGVTLLMLEDESALGVGAFFLLWLSIWSIGVVGLGLRLVNAWRGARSAGTLFSAMFLSLFSLPFFAGEVFALWILAKQASPALSVVLLCSIVLNVTFYQLLKAPTRAGRRLLDDIAGFRLYLEVAEKDELNFKNPPEKTPELFEKHLSYALALDVEQRWAERFARLFADLSGRRGDYTPGWYHGRHWNPHRPGLLAGAVGSSLSSALASVSTAPGSSSGAGGGGSSGGGGGGGGGGGW